MYRRLVAIPSDLVEAARAKQPSAERELYLRLRPLVSRVVAALEGRAAVTRDLCDDLSCRILVSLDRYRGEASFSTWAYASCVNALRTRHDVLRMETRRRELDAATPEAEPAEPPDAAFERRELLLAAADEVLHLPDTMRQCVVLHDVLGEPVAEAANQIGVTPQTVRNQALKGRRLVQRALAQRGLLDGERARRLGFVELDDEVSPVLPGREPGDAEGE